MKAIGGKALALAVALLAPGVPVAVGASEAPAAVQREVIPGSVLMTPEEREEYRQRMRGASTPAEEAKVRDEHRRRMQERARMRGLRLPDPAAGAR